MIKPQDVQFNEYCEALVDPGDGTLRVAVTMVRNAITHLDKHDENLAATVDAQILLNRCETLLHAEVDLIFRTRRYHYERTGTFTLGRKNETSR
jgi:hypothetical protein